MNLKERIDQLEERERKLLLIFFGTFGAMVLFLGPLALSMSAPSDGITKGVGVRTAVSITRPPGAPRRAMPR